MLNVGVLISGRGSNLQALIDESQKPGRPWKIDCVVSNNPEAPGIGRALTAKVPVHVVNHRDFSNREAFEKAMDAKLNEHGVQLVCMAGFMRLLTPWFVTRWRDKLINIHPSLLPAFPGLDTHKKALDYGAKFTGCTVHFVRAEMDHGPIIIQAAVPVLPGDTEESLSARVLEAEHKIYPDAVRLIAEGRVNIIEERVLVTGVETSIEATINPSGALGLARPKAKSS